MDSSGKHVRLLVLWTICLGLILPVLAQTDAVDAPATEPAPPASTSQPGASTQAAESTHPGMPGIEDALAGHFEEALVKLQRAADAVPKDPAASVAAKLLQEHLALRARAEAQRKVELAEAGRRVQVYVLAQESLPALAKEGLDKKLRDKVQEAVAAYNGAATSEALEGADEKEAAELKSKSLSALDKCAAAVAGAVKVLEKVNTPYADALRAVARTFDSLQKAHSQAWASVVTDSPKGRRNGAMKVKATEDDLVNAISDVEAMTSENPWRSALLQARLAKLVAVKEDNLAEQPWYKSLVADVERRAKDAEAKAQWYDALTAYAGLQDVESDNENYKQMVQTVQRHVRILGLYGKKSPTTQPATAVNPPGANPPPEEAETNWKDMVAGVDVDMIEKAISQLDGAYVSAVDYRKVARGGLMSVKVLAETPQASHSFPSLGDEAKRKAFLGAIEGQLETLEKRDRVDHLDLQLALNSVLRASERTVQIPTEVVVVEFADGFLDELDKFSSMIWPYDVSDFQKQTMGHFYGIGIQITKDPGEPLKVVTPLPGTPAFQAGVKTGDYILAVDGRRTEDLGVDSLVRRITGEKGTKVILQIKRQGVLKPFEVAIIRDEITIRTIKGWRQRPGGEWDYMIDPERTIAYVRITQFTDQTPRELNAALAEIRKAGVKSLIMDLRFNPGGLLRSATMVTDEFLRTGRIVSTRGRQIRQTEVNAQESGDYLDGDLVVLVNQHSASAAEIVSGAIKDWRRGTIVGQRTYGKGSVQNVIPIRNHRAFLKLTTAYYYLPSGRLLHRRNGEKNWGVDPDVEVQVTPRQIKRWLEIRRKTDVLQDVDPANLESNLAEQYDADVQLNTAVALLKLMQLHENKVKVAAG